MFFRSRRRRRAIETTDARTVAPFGFGAMSKRMSSTRADRDDDAPLSSVTFETDTETATETDDDDHDGSVYDVVPRSPRSSTPRGDIEETSRGRRVPPRRDDARDDDDDAHDRARTRPMDLAREEDAGVTRPRAA